MKRFICKHGVAIVTGVYCVGVVTVAGCSGGHVTTAPIAAGVRKCQDLPALEEEGGDDEDRSLSRWSPSSVDAGAAELL